MAFIVLGSGILYLCSNYPTMEYSSVFQPNFLASPRGQIADPDIYRQSFPQKRKAEEAWAMLSGDREFSIKLCRLTYKNFDLQWPNSREKRGFSAHTAGPQADKDPITTAALSLSLTLG